MGSVYRPLMQIYFFLAIGFFLYRIFVFKDKQREVLIAAAYMMGAEVYFRMTKAMVFYESGKYLIILFLTIGIFYKGFKKKSFPYLLYLLLLVPGIFVAYYNLDYEAAFRQMILFNLSGPICLTVASVYCYNRRVQFKEMLGLLDAIVYPLIAMTVYIYLYNPDIREVITSTASTSDTSGGYGPNQVATMLGLGVFILFTRLLIPYKNKLVHFCMMFFLVAMAYRALITFSRGGVLVAVIMVAVFSVILYFSTSLKTKFRITYKLIAVVGVVFAIWLYALLQTGGLIGNRYSNEDALGREKEDVTTGRTELLFADIDAFKESPIVGIGVGRVKGYYIEKLNIELPSHNEVARMLSEHGLFGLIALLILLFTPIVSKIYGRKNIFFYPLLLFWILTISHSAMRIAAPAFIYGLSLLSLQYGSKENPIHRKQLKQGA